MTFLASQQLPDGSFATTIFSDAALPDGNDYKIVFGPVLILGALVDSKAQSAQTIRAQLARYLLSQKNDRWSFNYWDRTSEQYQKTPYPDDLDDTFCAVAALRLHDLSLVDDAALAHLVKLLLATESQIGGPYKTWLVSPTAAQGWQDIDLAVNANIAYFLSLIGSELPKVTELLARAIKNQSFQSPYYPSEELVAYYVARAYHGERQNELAAWLRRKLRSCIGKSPLRTALLVSSLARLGKKVPEAAIHYLAASQQKNGSWPNEPAWLDHGKESAAFYAGSAALTTAFVIEAQERYLQMSVLAPKSEKHSSFDPRAAAIFTYARQATKQLDKTLHHTILALINRTAAGKNAHEITLLPYLVYASTKHRSRLSDQLLTELSVANLYGWIAYTIYDDFLDDEGDPRYLSAANVMMRRSVEAFGRALPENRQFQQVVRDTFDTIDAANAWEVTHARFVVDDERITFTKLPDYKRLDKLADRSLGHALPALGVVAAAGVPPNQESAKQLFVALRHYIIARQLNDDLHDWKEDLRAGRITYVLAVILKELNYTPGQYELNQLIPQLERQFWHHSLIRLCKRMKYHTHQSRLAIHRSGLLREQNILIQLIEKIDTSVNETLAVHSQTERFLEAYDK